MSQPAQIFRAGGSREYSVVDNSPAGNLGGIAGGEGYDTTSPGALGQGQNAFGNGTIPDALVPPLPGVGAILQKASAVSTGSVASVAPAFSAANTLGNTIVVVCGVGNGAAPTVADSQGNAYTRVAHAPNSTTFGAAVFSAVGIKAGANTVTVTNGGAAASMAAEIYEVRGLLSVAGSDSAATNTSGAATGSPAVTVNPSQVHDYVFAGFALGTAAQTITVGAGYSNDSGQLNPAAIVAGLFSLVSASLSLPDAASSSPSATVGVAEPWAVAVAAFKASTPSNVAGGKSTAGVFLKNPA